jgi:hypothetical protein
MFFTTFLSLIIIVIFGLRLTVRNGTHKKQGQSNLWASLASATSIRWVSGTRADAGTFKEQRHGYYVYMWATRACQARSPGRWGRAKLAWCGSDHHGSVAPGPHAWLMGDDQLRGWNGWRWYGLLRGGGWVGEDVVELMGWWDKIWDRSAWYYEGWKDSAG